MPPSPQTLAPVLSVAAPACARGSLRREPRTVQRPEQLDEQYVTFEASKTIGLI
jgi:hypothetical protein